MYLVVTIVGLLSISEALDGKWDMTGHLSFNLMKEENLEVHNAKIFCHGWSSRATRLGCTSGIKIPRLLL